MAAEPNDANAIRFQSFGIAAGVALITVMASQFLQTPSDLSTLRSEIGSLQAIDAVASLARDKIALSQGDVRERLLAEETISSILKDDMSQLLRRIERLEAVCYKVGR